MAKPNLQPIYNRLNGVQRYHPMSANTYGDWAMEAGDTVTVTQGNNSYQAPVHTLKLRWHGKQEIEINSDGNRERTPVSKVSQQKYNAGRGGGSYRSSQGLYYEMESEDGLLHATISATAQALTTEYRETVGEVENALTGKIEQTARSLTSTYDNKISQVRSQIKQEADRISLVVEGTGANAKIKPASIVAAINNGESTIRINADRVSLNGGTIRLSDAIKVTRSGPYVSTTVTGEFISERTLTIMSGGVRFVSGGSTRSIGFSDIGDMIKTAETISSGNTLRLTRFDGTYLDFNRAVSLTGGWSGGTYSVQATAGRIDGTAPNTTLFDLGLGTAAKGSGNTVTATYDIGYRTIVGGEPRRGGSTGKSGTLSLSVGGLLESETFDSNGTYTPSSGKLGFSSVTVNVPSGPSYSHDVTLTRKNMETYQAGGMTIYRFNYYVERNTASDPLSTGGDGGTRTVHW